MKGVIFDLDQTIVDSSISENFRHRGKWSEVYKMIPEFQIYKGIPELISSLVENGFKIAIVTTSPNSYAKRVLAFFNINFDILICYHDTKKRKPFPDQFLLAIEKLKLNPLMTYSLGDRAIDIQASKRANIVSCGCFWGTNEAILLEESLPQNRFYTIDEAILFFQSKY